MTKLVPMLALVLACAACPSEDRTPEGAMRQFMRAVESGQADEVYPLLAPETQQHLISQARLATEQTGGQRHIEPRDLLVTGMAQLPTKPSEIVLVDQQEERARVRISGEGKQHTVELVRAGRHWRVLLPEPPVPPTSRQATPTSRPAAPTSR